MSRVSSFAATFLSLAPFAAAPPAVPAQPCVGTVIAVEETAPVVIGERPVRVSAATRRQSARLRAHYAKLGRIVDATDADVAAAQANVDNRWSRQVEWGIPAKDKYGDPMYTAYGRRPYAGTPWYEGPAYAASFETEFVRSANGAVARGTAAFQPSSRDHERGFSGGARSVPATDTNLGSGASQLYNQSGMISFPGAIAPSAARPAQFNVR